MSGLFVFIFNADFISYFIIIIFYQPLDTTYKKVTSVFQIERFWHVQSFFFFSCSVPGESKAECPLRDIDRDQLYCSCDMVCSSPAIVRGHPRARKQLSVVSDKLLTSTFSLKVKEVSPLHVWTSSSKPSSVTVLPAAPCRSVVFTLSRRFHILGKESN